MSRACSCARIIVLALARNHCANTRSQRAPVRRRHPGEPIVTGVHRHPGDFPERYVHARRSQCAVWADEVIELKTATLGFLSPTLWLLGYPDQALAMSESNLSHARQLGYAFNLALAMMWVYYLALAMMWVYYTRMLRREYRAGKEQAEQLLELASRYGISDCIVAAKAQCALAKSHLEAGSDQTLAEVRQCIGDYRAKWDKFVVPYNLGIQASAVAAAGRSDAALSVIAEALALDTDECWSEAELQRLNGEIRLAEGGAGAVSDAEACFERSLDIARRQSARSWELRTVTSLARLWRDQGESQKARDLLAPLYGWFTEGFETQDLRDARALLDELR
jgi:hypothetical protein